MRAVWMAVALAVVLVVLLLVLQQSGGIAAEHLDDPARSTAAQVSPLSGPVFHSDALPNAAHAAARSTAVPMDVAPLTEEPGAAASPPTSALEIDVVQPSGQPFVWIDRDVFEDWTCLFLIEAIARASEPSAVLPVGFDRPSSAPGTSRFIDTNSVCGHRHPRAIGSIGCVEYRGVLPAWVSLVIGRHVILSQRVEAGADRVVFEHDPARLQAMTGRLTLRVVDAETAMPPTGISGSIGGPGETSIDLPRADSDGRIDWEGQPPLDFFLQVDCPGYESQEVAFEIAPGQTTDLGTFALSAARTIRGRVLDWENEPQSVGVLATAIDEAGRTRSGHRPAFQTSDKDGRFEMSGAGPWRYRLDVFANDWASVPVFLSAGRDAVEDVTVTVEPGTVLRIEGRWPAAEHHDMRLESDAGWRPWESEKTSGRQWSMRLPQGRYHLQLLTDGQVQKSVPLDLSGPELVVELTP